MFGFRRPHVQHFVIFQETLNAAFPTPDGLGNLQNRGAVAAHVSYFDLSGVTEADIIYRSHSAAPKKGRRLCGAAAKFKGGNVQEHTANGALAPYRRDVRPPITIREPQTGR